MIDVLTHYFRKGTRPFQTLSALPERQALSLMEALYVPGSILWRRFGEPKSYLDCRRKVEHRLFSEFKEKGGNPKNHCPIYFVVGLPKWAVEKVDSVTMAATDKMEVPLSIFDEQEISFTFPDSMYLAMTTQRVEQLLPNSRYRGEALTVHEMEDLIGEHDLPVEGWRPNLPPHLDHYIEAQVWNETVLQDYLKAHPWHS